MNMETQLEIEQADVQAPSDQMQDQTATPKSTEAEPKQPRKKAVLSPKAAHTYDTIVVGAGISGIAAAYKMKQVGYQDYLVLEKADRVGGTWRDNNYPGCGCDVPSALYSFSFAPSHQWSHLFAKQPEILSYLERVVKQFELQDKIRFQHELLSAKWNDEANIWQLETSQGTYQARTVIFSTGPITEPSLPKIKGIEGFKGEMFHSARWKHEAKELIVFQRTAPWVLPKADMQLNATVKSLVAKFPMIQQGWRNSVSSILNGINFGLRHPSLLEPVNFLSRQLLKLQIHDDSLRKAVTPNFSIGCKRLLFANNYYPALQQDNVTLLPQGLVEIDGQSVITANGERFEVDVIVWGTGFEVAHPPIGQRVWNAQGERLADHWKGSSPEAYLGTSLENVPNAFLVLGPNILVYDSFIGIAEAQIQYIVDGLLKMKQQGFKRMMVKRDVLRYHNAKVQTHLKTTVFNRGGCSSYYLDQNGRNFAAWPWSLAELKQRLSALELKYYDVVEA